MSDLIEFLNPPAVRVDLIDCEWTQGQGDSLSEFIQTRDVSTKFDDGTQCCKAASIKVDGKWYCGIHAKPAALEYLIANQYCITKD